MAATHLLVWNPAHFSVDGVIALREEILETGTCKVNWSVGRVKNIEPGSRFYMIRLGVPPKGIVAAGQIDSAPYRDEREDIATGELLGQNFVDIRFLGLNTLPVILWPELQSEPFSSYYWSARQSGPRIPDGIAQVLDALWERRAGLPPPSNAAEVPPGVTYLEGSVERVAVNRYERDPNARAACLAYYGYECQACDFIPAVLYGPDAEDLIEVHHVLPISELGSGYQVDPVEDLVPLCPNCHALVHQGGLTRPVGEIRRMVEETRKFWREQEVGEGDDQEPPAPRQP